MRSGPNGIGESSRFECRNGNWVTKIWKDNTQCLGEPTIIDTTACIHPHCTCKESANINNKLIEFKMYDDPLCNGDSFSTAAAVINQCFESNDKGYILSCTHDTIIRTEYENIHCNDNGNNPPNVTNITPQNTEYYCYSFKCGTNSVKFEDNKGERFMIGKSLLLVIIITIYMLLQNW